MDEIKHRTIQTNGVNMHIAEQGEGPLVLFCHGFPESWYSWRHQIEAVSRAGFHAVAPDMRGYGRTDQPKSIDQYTLMHLVGDMVGVLDALGADQAVIVGHDWGAPVAWNSAMMRPDRFRGVVGLSVPFLPRGSAKPTSGMASTETAQFYQLYFQEPGVAEAHLQQDVALSMRKVLTSGFEADDAAGGVGMVPRRGGFLDSMTAPGPLPPWLTQADLDFFVAEFRRAGFAGGLNWYRAMDLSWALTAPFAGATVTVPALYMAGDKDLVVRFPGFDRLIAALPALVPQLRRTLMFPGCGHWTQQERAAEVNAALLEFLHGL